ncbi:MAG: hypothetical protein GY915_05225 [bacterium]|nr:hypothetical protein [bacterium]
MKRLLLLSLITSLSVSISFAKNSDWQKYIPEVAKPHIPNIESSDTNQSSYYGPTSLLGKELKNVSIMGPGFIENSKIRSLDVSGPTEIKKSKIKNLTVRGPLKIMDHSKVKKDTLVMGPVEAEDTKFYGDLEVHSATMTFKNCHIKGNITVISEIQVPEVFLKKTIIEGRIYFKKRDGHVHNDSSLLKKGVFGERT